VLRAFIGSIKLTSGEYSIRLYIEPEKGTADSGDVELDIPDLFVVIGEAAKNCETSVALLIDELQYFHEKELGALIMALASSVVVTRLDQNFFRVRFDRLKPGEKKLLQAIAELGEGPYRKSEVAETMGLKVTSLSPRRASLIQKGMIYSPEYGEIAFTVPMFDDFMRRAMPNLDR